MNPFRIEPALPSGAYQTYAITQPRETHTRKVGCIEVNCQAMANGWVTNVDLSTDLGQRQSNYIKTLARRAFKVSKAGSMETFEFPPGERCFAEHRVPIDRPANFLKIPGDYRAFTGQAVPMRPADWVEDFSEHQDKIIQLQQRG